MSRITAIQMLLCSLIGLSGCGDDFGDLPPLPRQSTPNTSPESVKNIPSALAYHYSYLIEELEKEKISLHIEQIARQCHDAINSQCVVLSRSIATGDSPTGTIKIRADKASAGEFVQAYANMEHVVRRQTEAAEVTPAIEIAEKTLKVLSDRQLQLQEKLTEEKWNSRELMEISTALSVAQADIERISTKALLERQKRDTTTIDFTIYLRKREPKTVAAESFASVLESTGQALEALIWGAACIALMLFATAPILVWFRRLHFESKAPSAPAEEDRSRLPTWRRILLSALLSYVSGIFFVIASTFIAFYIMSVG